MAVVSQIGDMLLTFLRRKDFTQFLIAYLWKFNGAGDSYVQKQRQKKQKLPFVSYCLWAH